jgi:hypothetical protein
MMMKANALADRASSASETELRRMLGSLRTGPQDLPLDTLRFRPVNPADVNKRDRNGVLLSPLDITNRAAFIEKNVDMSSPTMSREAMLLRNLITSDTASMLTLHYDTTDDTGDARLLKEAIVQQQQNLLSDRKEDWAKYGPDVLRAALTADELVANLEGLRAISNRKVMTSQIMQPLEPPALQPKRDRSGVAKTSMDLEKPNAKDLGEFRGSEETVNQAYRALSESAVRHGLSATAMLSRMQGAGVLNNVHLVDALRRKIEKSGV